MIDNMNNRYLKLLPQDSQLYHTTPSQTMRDSGFDCLRSCHSDEYEYISILRCLLAPLNAKLQLICTAEHNLKKII